MTPPSFNAMAVSAMVSRRGMGEGYSWPVMPVSPASRAWESERGVVGRRFRGCLRRLLHDALRGFLHRLPASFFRDLLRGLLGRRLLRGSLLRRCLLCRGFLLRRRLLAETLAHRLAGF